MALCPPSLCSDRPGAAHVIGRGFFGIVFAFAIHAADGMNGRKVENVKAHAGHVVQPLGAVLQSSVAAGLAGAGARKHLIPGAEAGLFAIDDDCQFPAVGGCPSAIGVPDHQGLQFGLDAIFTAAGMSVAASFCISSARVARKPLSFRLARAPRPRSVALRSGYRRRGPAPPSNFFPRSRLQD